MQHGAVACYLRASRPGGRLDQPAETAAHWGASKPWKFYAPRSSGNATKPAEEAAHRPHVSFLYSIERHIQLINPSLIQRLPTMARFDAFSSDHDSLFNYSKFSPSNGSLASLTMNDSTCIQKFRERTSRLFDVENEKNQLIQVSQQARVT